MKKNLRAKNILCFILCTVMLITTISPVAVKAAGTPLIVPTDSKIVDTPTVNDWKNIFKEESTENAGGVWVDKSVFKSVQDYLSATSENESTSPTMLDETNHFLVSLSAIASSKSITGYSTVPTDTVFVLDMSSSMESSTYNYIDDLAISTNDAIKRLLSLNKNNRIAVVLYSGADGQNNNGTLPTRILMPLDRYETTDRDGDFIEYREIDGEEGIAVVSGVTNSRNQTNFGLTNNQSRWSSGTFTQDGIYVGANVLIGADTVINDPDNPQNGQSRMPIMVLMTDGAPSVFSRDFAGTMDGNTTRRLSSAYTTSTTSTGAATEFLVQLTAAWAKYQIEQHYAENDLLFYTLGLRTDSEFSTGSLNPQNPIPGSASDNGTGINRNLTNAQFRDILNGYWDGYLNNPNTFRLTNNTTANFTISTSAAIHETLKSAVTSTADEDLRSNGLNKYRYYVDAYYEADAIDQFSDAFNAIVDEIILQSKYYPTYVQEGSDINSSGFLSIVDTLDEYMQVIDIKNIQLGNASFYGRNAARELSSFDATQTPTQIQLDLLAAVISRLNTTEANAIEVIETAQASNKLYYTSDSDYNNAISWFGNYSSNATDATYIAPWNGKDDAPKPQDANCTIDSYYFYGMGDGAIQVSDMRHIAVEVITFFAGEFTGQSKVRIRIPASLLPLIEYDVELSGDTLESDVTSLTWNGDAIAPIRLLYEVGLEDHINSINIATTAPNAYNQETANYEFYTNKWDYSGGDINIGITPPRTVGNSYAYFNPSLKNEFAYYQYDEEIYIYTNGEYVLYTGQEQPSGSSTAYYAKRLMYTKPAQGQTTTPEDMYFQIDPSDLTTATSETSGSVTTWYVPKGTPTLLDGAKLVRYKDGDTSETADGGPTKTYKTRSTAYVRNAFDANSALDYYVETALGNNGKLSVTSAQGIRLSKYFQQTDVNSTVTADQKYSFTIESAPTTAALSGSYTYYVADGVKDNIGPVGEAKTAQAENGVITVSIKKHQTAYIVGLPTGDYIVNEVVPNDANYMLNSFRIDGELAPLGTAVTVLPDTLTGTAFLNIDRTYYGSFSLDKVVNSTYLPHLTEEYDFTFTITAELPADVAESYKTTYSTSLAGNVLDFTNSLSATTTVNLSHNERFSIPQLPVGTTITVAETHVNKRKTPNVVSSVVGEDTIQAFANGDYGFTTTVTGETAPTREAEATITANTNSAVIYTNTYEANSTTSQNIIVNVIKDFRGRENNVWNTDDSFAFTLTEVGETNTIASGTVYSDTTDYTIPLDFSTETYTKAGTYSYEVDEVLGNIAGVTYDTTSEFFDVIVADDGFGNLYINDVRSSDNGADNFLIATKQGDIWTVKATFQNIYRAIGRVDFDLGVQKEIKTNPESDAIIDNLEGYHFNLYNVTKAYNANNQTFEGLVLDASDIIATETTTHAGLADFRDIVFTKDTSEHIRPDFLYGETQYFVLEEEGGSDSKITYSNDIYVFGAVMSESATAEVTLTVSVYKGTKNGTTINNVTIIDANGAESGNALVATYDAAAAVPVVNFTPTITNIYNPEDAKITIHGNKTLTGRNMNANEFTMELYETNSTYSPDQMVPVDTVTVDAANANTAAAFYFDEITYDTVGDYYYIIKEKTSSPIQGVEYDETQYRVHVSVVNDMTQGTLVATHTHSIETTPTASIAFTNVYVPTPITATIDVNKSLYYTNGDKNIGFSAGTFEVGLYTKGGTGILSPAPLQTTSFGVSDANNNNIGTATFNLIYDNSDIGEHTYVVKEILPAGATEVGGVYTYNGGTYDLTEYEITVDVTYDNETGLLSADVTYPNNTTPEIQNTYTAQDTSVVFSGTKLLTDTKFEDGDTETFTMGLYGTDSQFAVADNATPLLTKHVIVSKNGDVISGDFTFDELPYTQSGIHYYVIKEIVPDNPHKLMIYDRNEYHITVVIADNGSGQLVANSTVLNVGLHANTAIDEVNFNNTKQHFDDLELTIDVTKTVNNLGNQKLSPNGFEFVLTETDASYQPLQGGLTQKTTSDSAGMAAFDVITMVEATTRYFTVTETAANRKHVTYDDTVYEICVEHSGDTLTITCNPQGTLLGDNLSLSFENTYDHSVHHWNPPTPTSTPAPTLPDVPKTGDSPMMTLWITMIAIGILGFISTALYALRRRK